jgi:hypothetical protein
MVEASLGNAMPASYPDSGYPSAEGAAPMGTLAPSAVGSGVWTVT